MHTLMKLLSTYSFSVPELSSLCFISLITRQGLPTAIVHAGMSFVTTEPAPIIAPSPMVTPGITMLPMPR